jgi:uncharacterized repeat protein (TIGR01451 family)
MHHTKHSRAAARAVVIIALALMWHASAGRASAADLTLSTGGRVSVELVNSDASFSNTLSLVSPGNVAARVVGCRVESSPQLPGLKLVSEKPSQHGCRIELDADASTPAIDPFEAGTILRFNLCSQEDADPDCEHVWSSDPASNSDGFEHVATRAVHAAEFPGRIFQLNWEDLPGGGDRDFNDLIAVLRVDGDTDGDGLWDDWERFGIDADGNGTVDLDLPRLLPVDLNNDGDTSDPGERTSPTRKDIFLEIDYMDCAVSGGDCAAGDRHSHRPNADAIRAVVRAFRDAPVANPDGSNGITFHVAVSNSIRHRRYLNIPGGCFQGGAGIGDFDAVKRDPANFGPNNPRRFAFHYSLFTHLQIPTNTSTGCGEFPGNDFQVALGGAPGGVGTIQQQAGTLMHELGHNLNLGHGGGDSVNFKPNYLSIMNYWFQLSGIPPTDPDGTGPLRARIDYSRAALRALDEARLSEPAGIGDGRDNTFFYCPQSGTGSGAGNSPIDWVCDGDAVDVNVASDLNREDGFTVLRGFNDWRSVLYAFQGTASFADGEHIFSTPLVELDFETYARVIAPELSISVAASPDPVLTGSDVTYTITVHNSHPEAAESVTVADVLPPETTFVSCDATGGGICGGTNNARTVRFDAIPGGASVTVRLVAKVSCPVRDGTPITNAASVSSEPPDADRDDNSASATVTASNPPPVITGEAVNVTALQPPNHKMRDVTVSYTVKDNCGPLTNRLSVTSNEPANGTGDGDTAPDWEILDANRVRLRAERSGRGNGRVYTITITSTDSAGGSSSKQVFVRVPHDQGR